MKALRLPVLAAVLAASLAACNATGPEPRAAATEAMPEVAMRLPSSVTQPPRRPNAQMGRDYLDLVFALESGREVPRLTRYEGPVTVSLEGPAPATTRRDLGQLLGRLRSEAGIDIRESAAAGTIRVIFLPRRLMQNYVPTAACFVAPNVTGWRDYLRARGSERVDWASLNTRGPAAVFVPSDTAPQEVRDCLHEEIAQALGPLNDLYRLSDTIFNDDNFHGTLTGFDMLMLRLHYAPELRNGMTRAEAALALPRALQRLNPGGGPVGALPAGFSDTTPRRYIDDIEAALGGRRDAGRRSAAADAAGLALAMGWRDNRTAFALYSLGRLSLADDPRGAVGALAEAAALWAAEGARAQVAHVDLYIAGLALQTDALAEVIALADRSLPVAKSEGNAALVASLLAMKAAALERKGDAAGARHLRLDSAGWARYGFGSQAAERMADIAGLLPAATDSAQR